MGDIPDDVEKRLEEAKAVAAERDGIDRIISDITGELEQVTPGEVQKAAEELAKAQKEVEMLEKSAGEFAEDPAEEAKKLAGRAEKLAEEAGAAEDEHLNASKALGGCGGQATGGGGCPRTDGSGRKEAACRISGENRERRI